MDSGPNPKMIVVEHPVFWLMVNGNPALTLTKFLKTLRSMSFRRC